MLRPPVLLPRQNLWSMEPTGFAWPCLLPPHPPGALSLSSLEPCVLLTPALWSLPYTFPLHSSPSCSLSFLYLFIFCFFSLFFCSSPFCLFLILYHLKLKLAMDVFFSSETRDNPALPGPAAGSCCSRCRDSPFRDHLIKQSQKVSGH